MLLVTLVMTVVNVHQDTTDQLMGLVNVKQNYMSKGSNLNSTIYKFVDGLTNFD